MKKRITAIIVIAMIIMMVPAYALADEKSDAVESYIKSNISVDSAGGLSAKKSSFLEYVKLNADSEFTQAVTLSDGVTIVYYSEAKLDAMYRVAENEVSSEQVGEKVNEMTDGFGVEADLTAAGTMLGGFKPIIETVVGILVYVITIGMTLFTTFDVAFIAFPVLRNKMEDAKVQGGNSFLTKQTANNDTRLRWVSDDAQYAVQVSQNGEGKSPWGVYFKKRVLSYVFLAIVLFILVTGNISVITSVALNLVSGIMDVLTSMA